MKIQACPALYGSWTRTGLVHLHFSVLPVGLCLHRPLPFRQDLRPRWNAVRYRDSVSDPRRLPRRHEFVVHRGVDADLAVLLRCGDDRGTNLHGWG